MFLTSVSAPFRLSQMWGSYCPCSLTSPGSVFLRGSAPFEASTATRSGLSADWTALSAQASIPNPLYTNTFALPRLTRSCAFGSKSCGSVPFGMMVVTSTLSLPTASANSFIALNDTETCSFPSGALLSCETAPAG